MKPEPFTAVLPGYLVAFINADEMMDYFPAFLLSELTRTTAWEERFEARAARPDTHRLPRELGVTN